MLLVCTEYGEIACLNLRDIVTKDAISRSDLFNCLQPELSSMPCPLNLRLRNHSTVPVCKQLVHGSPTTTPRGSTIICLVTRVTSQGTD